MKKTVARICANNRICVHDHAQPLVVARAGHLDVRPTGYAAIATLAAATPLCHICTPVSCVQRTAAANMRAACCSSPSACRRAMFQPRHADVALPNALYAPPVYYTHAATVAPPLYYTRAATVAPAQRIARHIGDGGSHGQRSVPNATSSTFDEMPKPRLGCRK